jgi:uncharacterized membrane protein HdeD (DUF308 family)
MKEFADAVKTGGKKMTIFGVIAIILGILAMLMPGLTGISVVFFLGLLVLVAGIVRILWAFQAGSFGKGLLMFAIGGLTLLCGIALVANPLFGSGVLTIMLALYFILDGISEVVAGIKLRPDSGWGWMLFGGIDLTRHDDLGAVPTFRRVGHWHPAGHQALLRRPDHDHRRFGGAFDVEVGRSS